VRWRFTLAATLVSLVALAALLIPLAGYLRGVETDRITTTLERDAFMLAGRNEEALEGDGESAAITELAREYRENNGARVVVVDAAGIAIVTSDDDPVRVGDSYASRPEIAAALEGEISTGTRFSTTLGIDLLYVAVPVLSGPDVLGAVRLTYPASVVNDAVNGKIAALGLATLTTVVTSSVVGLIFASGVTRRLRRVTDLTEKFAEGDLDARADESGGAPELRSLARSFNTMAGRVTEAIDQQRRFAADASHQLRTPITALRLRLDRARELAEAGRAAEAAERIAAATDETERLTALIEGLLALTRSEGDLASLERVDLVELARERVEHWEPLAAESGIRLIGPTGGRRLALTSAGAVGQILDTLLDNALVVSRPGDPIEVTVTAEPDPVIHVLDRGPGMPEADLAAATERFWTTRPGGTGLGLSIAQRLAATAGGRLELSNRPDGGFDAALVLAAEWTPRAGGGTTAPLVE
jgi:signal transduction histidine kinase